jgi:uncharacterized protein (TIGR03067 family)
MPYFSKLSWFVIVCATAVLPACTNSSSDTPQSANITGDYRIVSGERNGVPIDPKELDAVITIRDTTITAYDRDRKETFSATYTIETIRKPWQITMTSIKAPETGVVAKGLIEADQDRLKLIYALPKGQTPTDFQAGEQQQMFVLAKTNAATSNERMPPAGT